MKIHLIAAARPNFMKIAPLYHALKKEDWATPFIVHTGQHYDINMSDVFFKDLGMPEPDIHLGVGSRTHAQQTGEVMIAYEKIVEASPPDLVIVVGDVNSTMAVTIVAAKLGIKVGHLEAGLRSFDRTMPEEINRMVTDTLADILWTPSLDGDENLVREGMSEEKIIRVGNIMIDSLEMLRDKIEAMRTYEQFGFRQSEYGLVTFHRPSNVDDPDNLKQLCETLIRISKKIHLLFPVHPRTEKNLKKYGIIDIFEKSKNIVLSRPINYINFMNLVFNCRIVITDSGGIQEETTYLGIPCMTMRPNTERPITIDQGTNRLCTIDNLKDFVETIISQKAIKFSVPELWDGKTASRVVESVKSFKA